MTRKDRASGSATDDSSSIRFPLATRSTVTTSRCSHEVLQRDVVTIDLRLPDRLVVRTAPGAVLPGQDPAGEDT